MQVRYYGRVLIQISILFVQSLMIIFINGYAIQMKRKFGLEYLKLVDKKRNTICYDISKNILSIITKNYKSLFYSNENIETLNSFYEDLVSQFNIIKIK